MEAHPVALSPSERNCVAGGCGRLRISRLEGALASPETQRVSTGSRCEEQTTNATGEPCRSPTGLAGSVPSTSSAADDEQDTDSALDYEERGRSPNLPVLGDRPTCT